MRRPTRPAPGFTLIELLVTIALVGLMASLSVPLYELAATRQKESELRDALRTIRTALDAYKQAVDAGMLAREAGDSGYPPSLEVLTEALPRADASDPDGPPALTRLQLLRRLPRDPFHEDPLTPAAQTWHLRSYASRTDDPQPGADVFDVSSQSPRIALDGTPYASW